MTRLEVGAGTNKQNRTNKQYKQAYHMIEPNGATSLSLLHKTSHDGLRPNDK